MPPEERTADTPTPMQTGLGVPNSSSLREPHSPGSQVETLAEQVYRHVRWRIAQGELAAEQHLPETTLADELGVSRQPVREALRLLARDGWVRIEPRRGAFVTSPVTDAERVQSYFHARHVLEGELAALAASRLTADGDAALAGANERGRQAAEMHNLSAYMRACSEFHDLVARLSGNAVLAELWDALSREARWNYAPQPLLRDRAVQEHEAVHDAIRTGDASVARAAMQTHLWLASMYRARENDELDTRPFGYLF